MFTSDTNENNNNNIGSETRALYVALWQTSTARTCPEMDFPVYYVIEAYRSCPWNT